MGLNAGPADERRREFVAFVRRHHPDVGGDPEVFRRGLAEFLARADATGAAGPDRIGASVEIHRRRGGPGVFWHRLVQVRRRRRRPPRVQ